MNVYFEDSELCSEALKAEAIERWEGAKAARKYILEDKYYYVRTLVNDFTRLFGEQPATEEAQAFLDILRGDFENTKEDLSAIYGRDID